MGIETDVDGPPVGLGDGDGDGDGTGEGAEAEYPPHAPVISTNADTSTRRDENMKTSVFYMYRQTRRNHFGELEDLQPSDLPPPPRYRRAAYRATRFARKRLEAPDELAAAVLVHLELRCLPVNPLCAPDAVCALRWPEASRRLAGGTASIVLR